MHYTGIPRWRETKLAYQSQCNYLFLPAPVVHTLDRLLIRSMSAYRKMLQAAIKTEMERQLVYSTDWSTILSTHPLLAGGCSSQKL